MGELHELLIATRNAGKVEELTELLADLPHLRLRSLADWPRAADVAETGKTCAENAVLKARHYAAESGLWALSDDSGLEVDALGGAPGVYSARYAGPGASDAERMARLLSELSAAGGVDRGARFVCVIALARPSAGAVEIFSGTCEGRIAEAPHGTSGFGYDPIFVPHGYDQSFGELPSEIKNRISHRARALAAAHSFLRGRLEGTA